MADTLIWHEFVFACLQEVISLHNLIAINHFTSLRREMISSPFIVFIDIVWWGGEA